MQNAMISHWSFWRPNPKNFCHNCNGKYPYTSDHLNNRRNTVIAPSHIDLPWRCHHTFEETWKWLFRFVNDRFPSIHTSKCIFNGQDLQLCRRGNEEMQILKLTWFIEIVPSTNLNRTSITSSTSTSTQNTVGAWASIVWRSSKNLLVVTGGNYLLSLYFTHIYFHQVLDVRSQLYWILNLHDKPFI